jgi:hypothetical protein
LFSFNWLTKTIFHVVENVGAGAGAGAVTVLGAGAGAVTVLGAGAGAVTVLATGAAAHPTVNAISASIMTAVPKTFRPFIVYLPI